MDAVQHFQTWVIGETAQGRVMLVVGILLSIAAFLIFKSDNPLLRGALIPVIVLLAINLGYGAVLVSRPSTSQSVEAAFRQNENETRVQQVEKATKDAGAFASLRPIWAALIAISLVSFLVLANDYYRGLSLSLAALFLGALIIDSFLHHRLVVYAGALQGLGGQAG